MVANLMRHAQLESVGSSLISSAQLSCTEFCACQGSGSVACYSKWTKAAEDNVDDMDESWGEDDGDV